MQDCSGTVEEVLRLLNDGQTHGRAGQVIARVATHWKIKEKTKELGLLRSKVISFHTAMNMNLQMIHICIFFHAQEVLEAKQNNVQDGITQLRQQIQDLTNLSLHSKRFDRDPIPATVTRSLDAAIALDESASTITGDTHSEIGSIMSQKPPEKVSRWMQIRKAWERPISKADTVETASEHIRSDRRSDFLQQQALQGQPSGNQAAKGTGFSVTEEQYIRDLQRCRALIKGECIEQAKSLCRKVIHQTDLNIGTVHLIHKDALELLAGIYEHTEDHNEAARVRLLLEKRGFKAFCKEFKTLVQTQDLKKCINYAFSWAILLHDNASLQVWKTSLGELVLDGKFHEPILFVAVCIMGDIVLEQLLLAQGVSIHAKVDCSRSRGEFTTPLESAISLRHYRLVQILLESGSDNLDLIVETECLEQAVECWDFEILRMLLDHMARLLSHPKCVASDRSLQATEPEKLKMGFLLSKKVEDQSKNRGKRTVLCSGLYKAVDRKDLAMARLLLGYGANDGGIVRYSTEMHWLEGIELLASQKGLVTLEDIMFAYNSTDDSVGNLLLSLNPSFVHHVVNKVMEVSGLNGLTMALSLGANVNAPSYWGSWQEKTWTFPLHFAVRKASSHLVKALMNAGADVHMNDKAGQTALQYAINLHHEEKNVPETQFLAILEIISLLRKAGATCGTKTPWAWSPFSRDRRVAAAYRGAGKK